MPHRPFRFGIVAAQARTGEEWREKARRIESLGFSTMLIPDNVEYIFAPLVALTAAATATSTLRVGSYVLANDYRNPVLLAKEAATLDLLSGGRFELGLGAGRPGAERDNQMLGIPFESGGRRLAKLEEAITIIKALFTGETAPAGTYYRAANPKVWPRPLQTPVPLLIAGSGPRLLALAGREANIVGLGLAHETNAAGAAEKIAVLREAAGDRFGEIELNVNLAGVGNRTISFLARQPGKDLQTLAGLGSVSVLPGAVDEMCEILLARRDALGISYYLTGDELMDELAPVVARLAGQ